jgi:diaminopimelate epimerase
MLKENFFIKSHGLGNDYLIVDKSLITFTLAPTTIQKICDVHFGIGSDGILLMDGKEKDTFKLRIYNPDGSEAEKSGNGLRIFAKFLYDYGYTYSTSFNIETLGGIVRANINKAIKGKARLITIDMGKAIFNASEIPVKCAENECMDYPLEINGQQFNINCVSMGNPHCVIISDTLDENIVKSYGSAIENHPLFPNRINVQFVKIISNSEIEMLIWERGAGYTLASGSSSCAAVAVLYKKGLVDKEVVVNTPGGQLIVTVEDNWEMRLCGEVQQVAEGIFAEEFIEELNNL